MKRLSIISILVIVFTSGCIFQSSGGLSVSIASITSDKTEYRSFDDINLNITIESSDILEDVFVNASGIRDKYGKLHVKSSLVVNLSEGDNEVLITNKLPACNKCKGLNPGVYSINVTVSYNGSILDENVIDINLKQ